MRLTRLARAPGDVTLGPELVELGPDLLGLEPTIEVDIIRPVFAL